jgi:uncharacterized protein (DUF927 family)
MGIIESLNEWPNSAALIEALAQKCRQYYGAVGREWLRRLVANRKALATELRGSVEAIANQLLDGLDAGGQVRRVARRFALAAAAGDLATRYELTPWAEDAGFSAAKACFNAWLEKYGGAKNREERMLIEQVRAFLEAHGASRFEPHDRFPEDSGPRPISNSASRSDDGSKPRSVISRPVINRAGFTRPDADGNMEYLVLREAFRSDVVKGFDPKWAATVLKERGLLVCQPPHLTCNARIPALADKGTTRVYVLSAAAVGIEKGGAA